MMERGNAVDAALNVVAPHAAGVGGDVGVPAPSSGSLLVEGRQDLLIQALEGFDVTGPRGQHDLIDTRVNELANAVNDVSGGPSNGARTCPLDEFIHFSLIVRELRRHENCMLDLSGITSNIFTVSINYIQLVSI